jgi:endonuclease/exonuclease/phosphatase family metal-dependent hydrolase
MSREMEGHRGPLVTVMTQNLYLGAELAPIFLARSQGEMVAAAGAAWEQVQASEIEERAHRIAEVIAVEAPDLVALQEAAQWSAGRVSAMTVKYDFLSSILQGLNESGLFYVPVAINHNLDRTAPIDMAGSEVRIIDRDAVLLKIGDAAAQMRPYNIQSQIFTALLPITSPVMGRMNVLRGWIAIHATIDGQKLCFLNTHLESYDGRVQTAQAAELVAGPGNTSLPLIVAGDFNSNADQKADDAPANENTRTYDNLIASGLRDVWADVNPAEPGNTCCQRADLMNDSSALFERIDLVLVRGGITPVAAKLVADQASAKTASGRWPSDHSGLVAKLRID